MISESMKKKYFDRWTDSSYGDDVVTTSIGYNYIDNQEDYEMQLWYLEDPTNKTREQEKFGYSTYKLRIRKDACMYITDHEIKEYDLIIDEKHFILWTNSFVHLVKALRKFYPQSVDELKMVETDSFVNKMRDILQNFCTQNNLPQYDPDDLLYGEYEGKRIPLTEKQKSFLISFISLWDKGEV
tara:strand:+ start:1597 stop:2148 length:552 start_codon:yes stop_codon:yes gene_type:complete